MFQEPGSLHINWSRISHFHPQMICLTPLGQSKDPSFVKYALSNLSMKIESKCYHSCGSFYSSRFYQLNSQAPVRSVVTGKFCILSYLSLSGITGCLPKWKHSDVPRPALVKNTVSWTQMGVCSSFPLSSFILFFFSYPLLSLGSPSPTRLFAFCSSWFLSHFPGGSTSSPIRVAAKQEMAKMRVLWEEGFLFLFLF